MSMACTRVDLHSRHPAYICVSLSLSLAEEASGVRAYGNLKER